MQTKPSDRLQLNASKIWPRYIAIWRQLKKLQEKNYVLI